MPVTSPIAHSRSPALFARFAAATGIALRYEAVDVTPAELVTGIICEKGVVLNPDRERLKHLYVTALPR